MLASPQAGSEGQALSAAMDWAARNGRALKLGLAGFSLLVSLAGSGVLMALVVATCVASLARADAVKDWLLSLDDGSDKMRQISDAIREGSESFFRRVYGTIARLSLPVAAILALMYAVRGSPAPHAGGSGSGSAAPAARPSDLAQAVVVGLTFLGGAACSGMAGYTGLWISVRTNVRTTAAAVKLIQTPGSTHPITIALQGGCVAAVMVVGMVVMGVAVLYSLFRVLFPYMDETDTPLLLVGFGFGASFVALFAQLGGGIFTKAADVGADLVGKVEAGIPEDDPRNPAVIADLVGDNVGDCSARGADLFESISAEIISSMILGGSLAKAARLDPAETRGFILFPLVVHCMDLVASGVGVLAASRAAVGGGPDLDPIATLKRGHRVALAAAVLGLVASTRVMLYTDKAPTAWLYFFACSVVGAVAGFLSIAIAEYYTDVPHAPVQSIIRASESGPATNVIAGLSVGMNSTGPSVLVVGLAILASYWIGEASGLGSAPGSHFGGLFGTAVATMGALSCGAYVLASDVFGPIADNAGGISEMSEQPESVRHVTDKLDAVGNSTKAATKSFALSSATLASFLLLRAFMDEVEAFTGARFSVVDVTLPEVFVAGLAGATLIFVFAGYATSAVGEAAGEVVTEVRRQFREIPGIMQGTAKPDYSACVDIVAKRALELMVRPGVLAVSTPVVVGLAFRFVGGLGPNSDGLTGARALVGFLVFNTATGILMGLFLSNAGGAWDNAKKGIEARGGEAGKGSKTHHAAVVGDTIGDPLKDTAGPSLHVVIKLVATVALVCCPVFVG